MGPQAWRFSRPPRSWRRGSGRRTGRPSSCCRSWSGRGGRGRQGAVRSRGKAAAGVVAGRGCILQGGGVKPALAGVATGLVHLLVGRDGGPREQLAVAAPLAGAGPAGLAASGVHATKTANSLPCHVCCGACNPCCMLAAGKGSKLPAARTRSDTSGSGGEDQRCSGGKPASSAPSTSHGAELCLGAAGGAAATTTTTTSAGRPGPDLLPCALQPQRQTPRQAQPLGSAAAGAAATGEQCVAVQAVGLAPPAMQMRTCALLPFDLAVHSEFWKDGVAETNDKR